MSTTTIRIDDALKARIAAAAERLGKSPHALIVESLAETVDRLEIDDELQRAALESWADVQNGGKTISLEDARADVRARLAASKAVRKGRSGAAGSSRHGPR